MRKRILGALLCLCLMIGLMPVSVQAEEPTTPGTFTDLGENGICFRYNGNNVLKVTMPTTVDSYSYGTATGGTATEIAYNAATLPADGWNWAVRKHAPDANGVEYTFIMNDFNISYYESGMGDGKNDGFLYSCKLNLELHGTNTLSEMTGGFFGIYSNISGKNDLYISGDGSLSVSGGSHGYSGNNVYVQSGTVEFASGRPLFMGRIYISGGTFIVRTKYAGISGIEFGCGVTAQASVNSDGSNPVAYNGEDASTYKWIQTAYNTPTASKQDGQPATCTLDGWKDYYQCSGCMKYYVDEACTEEIHNLETWKQGEGRIPATDHSYSTTWSYDGVEHWHAATCGHDVVSGKAAHNGGTADCKDKAVCADCGQPYGELAAHSESRQDGQVASCTNDGWKDYYQCSECMKYYVDEACTEEIRNLETWKQGEGRIPATDHSYSTTWSYDGVEHWYAATCGHDVVSGKAAHNGGTADCKAKAVCADCGQPYGVLAAHSGSVEWKNDATNHWKECTVEACGVKLDSATHEFEWKIDKDATENENGSKHEECKVCSYKKDAVDIPATGMDVEEEEPETDKTPQAVETSVETQPPKTGDNGMAVLWIALMFISGFSVVAATVIGKKRNSIR